MILEEQIPCFPVLIQSARLQRRRDVEHHDVLLMMCEDAREIVPADRVRPSFDKRFDLRFGCSGLLYHGSLLLFADVCFWYSESSGRDTWLHPLLVGAAPGPDEPPSLCV